MIVRGEILFKLKTYKRGYLVTLQTKTLRKSVYIYFAQLRHHQGNTDLYNNTSIYKDFLSVLLCNQVSPFRLN